MRISEEFDKIFGYGSMIDDGEKDEMHASKENASNSPTTAKTICEDGSKKCPSAAKNSHRIEEVRAARSKISKILANRPPKISPIKPASPDTHLEDTLPSIDTHNSAIIDAQSQNCTAKATAAGNGAKKRTSSAKQKYKDLIVDYLKILIKLASAPTIDNDDDDEGTLVSLQICAFINILERVDRASRESAEIAESIERRREHLLVSSTLAPL